MDTALPIDPLLGEGIEHHVAGRYSAAVACYSRLLAAQPQHADAWRLAGIVALQTGDHQTARDLLEQARHVAPGDSAVLGALGALNESERKLEAAYAAYAAACRIDAEPASLAGLFRVGLELERTDPLLPLAAAALARGIRDAGLLRSIGAARLRARDYAGAATALTQSIELVAHPDALANIGAAYVHLRRVADALAACQRALELDPTHVGAAINLGIAHRAQADYPAALAAFERAVDAGSDDAHMSLGTNLLLLGDYHAGWPHYGWLTAERRANPAFAALPLWDGTPARTARLLVWHEQGVGDTLQMVRFIARARALVGSVTLAGPPGTLELLRTVAGVDAVIDITTPQPFDAFDLWLPTIRLPVVFDVDRADIPAAPYLHADPARIDRFRSRLAHARRRRIGLVWSGNVNFEWNAARSCPLENFAPLASVADVTWFALQQGVPSAELPPPGLELVPINAEVADFADTAAIIAQLDLLISVDTSVANLAGALGRPAWILLATRADWRWQCSGETSPWYPTLRLFRQAREGEWGPVIAAVAAALAQP